MYGRAIDNVSMVRQLTMCVCRAIDDLSEARTTNELCRAIDHHGLLPADRGAPPPLVVCLSEFFYLSLDSFYVAFSLLVFLFDSMCAAICISLWLPL